MSQLLNIVRESGLKAIPQRLWYVQRKRGLRERIRRQYGTSTDPEVREVMAFLTAHPSQELPMGMIPPYDWTRDYSPELISIGRDPGNGLLCVKVKEHKVYFPRRFSPAEVQRAVSIGLMEQDGRSPHCYVGKGFTVDDGDVAGFIGASDGLFCLSLVNQLSKAYLFEPNSDWHEPLRSTFAPWGNRVEIVPLAVGSKDGEGRTRLDTFFKERPPPNYMQVDVDGVEQAVLEGANCLLRNAAKLRLSICTYHKRLDFQKFEQLLGGLEYSIHHSPGFFLIGVRMPYLRRGILYASRGMAQPAFPAPPASE
ncbi:MAG TPA: hypothetical protein VMJ12_14445 [Candidatus Acidoferrales bacterium]|nr:hypothetical protein [Candidatus Acidoferrales bacterium]